MKNFFDEFFRLEMAKERLSQLANEYTNRNLPKSRANRKKKKT